jgi:hypothetical protein
VPVRADECLASSAVAQETKIALTVGVIAITTGTWLDWSVRMLLDEPSETSCELWRVEAVQQLGLVLLGDTFEVGQQIAFSGR